MKIASLTQQQLFELVTYDATTGEMHWKKRPLSYFTTRRAWSIWNAQYPGKLMGCNYQRYRVANICGKTMRIHRLAWLYVYGSLPHMIDHINGDGTDNRIENLREVTHSVNAQNAKRPNDNTSGSIGVSWDKRRSKWRAYITINQKRIELGNYPHKHDAITARLEAATRYGFHPNHGRISAIPFTPSEGL